MATIVLQRTGQYMTFDAMLECQLEASNEVPEHPVDGVDADFVGDHSQAHLDKYSMIAEVTATPWALAGGIAVIGPALAPKKFDPTLSVLTTSNALPVADKRLEAARDFLADVRNELVTVITRKFGVLTDCLIKSYSLLEDNKERWQPRIEFTQNRFAEAAFIQLPAEVKRFAKDDERKDTGDTSQGAVRGRTFARDIQRVVSDALGSGDPEADIATSSASGLDIFNLGGGN